MADVNTRASESDSQQNAWQDGPYLVVRRKWNDFPDRCIVCNSTATARLKLKVRELTASDKAVMAFALAGPLLALAYPYLPSATVNVGLCPEHRSFEIQRRRRFRALWLAGAMIFISPLIISNYWDSELLVWAFVVGICVLATALIYPVMRKRLITGKKIEKRFLWLDKVDPSYLQQFPPIPAIERRD